MPTIYDNIEKDLLDGLKDALRVAKRGDFCVGYFNLRGWRRISNEIESVTSDPGAPKCRLIVGMLSDPDRTVRNYYGGARPDITQKDVVRLKKSFAASLKKQLTYGIPTIQDEKGLCKLARQLRKGILQVKFFGAYPLHAKLYLAHRDDDLNPITGYVGSSNLTLAGLEKQGELNVDVLDRDAAEKLAGWFEARWEDRWCLDITEELADILENSWAGGPVKPFEIYIKTAYELSKEAIEGSREFKVPSVFNKVMLEFQRQAVSLAAERLSRHGGVIVGDVVGLGKTLVASAVAKTFQDDRGDNVLIICPPKLQMMWQDYLHMYRIAGETLSLGMTNRLHTMRRYRLVVIDESHNLRNRNSRRYGHVHDYLRNNESRVILLTATPYNKQFIDIANQLRLFVKEDADLGTRPESYINSLGGGGYFKQRHPNTLITSLTAFERSEAVDDWRELMRMFMVRRTRSHIKKNYAQYDEERRQHYLSFDDNSRFYFPHRTPKCAKFKHDANDQYARLYSRDVVQIIESLELPRYGIGQYLLPEYQEDLPEGLSSDERRVIKNLSRAGARLIGFAKAGLFKRLESSGHAFLLSIRRHIIRNAVYLSALKQDGEFPIGNVFGSLADEMVEEDESDVFDVANRDEVELNYFLETGAKIYAALSHSSGTLRGKFDWIKTGLFDQSLSDDLLSDCNALLKILNVVPQWDADTDRKLEALHKLCGETHTEEKLLIFTQFKDTADYLHRQLTNLGIDRIAKVFGGMDDISDFVKRFSPVSNGEEAGGTEELRVLITTDTLSEGQNLQDAHIVVNFDLPWAIIRLVQRAGRVDRIGQQARKILCYCFLPEEGIEEIIALRKRLQDRIEDNAELIGSDERFFEGDKVNLEQVYAETIDLEGSEGETDLISRAYDIWQQAIKGEPELKKKIKTLSDVVYSAKKLDDEQGVIAYIKTSNNQHILAQINEDGEVISQSQSKLLDLLACEPQEPTVPPAENHHELVAAAVHYVKEGHLDSGGQLGGTNSIRHSAYSKAKLYLEQQEGTLFYSETMKQAVEQIYNYPLKETARDRLGRHLRAHIGDDELMAMIKNLYESGELCAIPQPGEPVEPRIICSMGLQK